MKHTCSPAHSNEIVDHFSNVNLLVCKNNEKCLLFSSIDVDNFVLIDVLEYVGRVHEDADGSDGGDDEEDVQLKSINNHRDKLPVLTNLKTNR